MRVKQLHQQPGTGRILRSGFGEPDMRDEEEEAEAEHHGSVGYPDGDRLLPGWDDG
jgi:hypothetical protein